MDDPFDAKIEILERRITRILKMIATLAASIVLTALTCIAAWDQIHDKIAQVDTHLENTDTNVSIGHERLDAVGAPNPTTVTGPPASVE